MGTTYPMAEGPIPEVLIPQQHHCENIKSYDDKLFSDIFFLTCMKLIPHTAVHLSSTLRTNNAINNFVTNR
jgi:hypothetical protein